MGEKQWVGEPVLWMKWTHFGTLLARDASAPFFSEYARLFVDHLVKSDHWATDVWMDEDDLEELVRRASGEDEDARQSPSQRSLTDKSAWAWPSARPSVTSWIRRKTRSLTELAQRATS